MASSKKSKKPKRQKSMGSKGTDRTLRPKLRDFERRGAGREDKVNELTTEAGNRGSMSMRARSLGRPTRTNAPIIARTTGKIMRIIVRLQYPQLSIQIVRVDKH
jgi:hypothetical protein